jgi:hypothetical protein
MTKFIRTATVIIRIRRDDFTGYEKTIRLSGLRVSFNIQKNLAWSTNVGNIKIWNLSRDHRNLIKDYGDEVTVYAGYERGSGEELLYVGDTTTVYHTYDLPDIVTTLECGDGERYVNQKHFSLSFQAGTSAREVIQTIAKRMGIPITEFANSDNLVYDQGFECAGMGKEALLKACSLLNLQASVQNETLQIIPVSGVIDETAFLINGQTGMIGIPQRYTYKRQDFYVQGPAVGWRVATLLYPKILPGSKLDISSQYLGFQGIFRCETIRHSGDTFGMQWESNMEVTQLNP